jgi:hypothetical protein
VGGKKIVDRMDPNAGGTECACEIQKKQVVYVTVMQRSSFVKDKH